MSKVITFSRTFPAYHPKKGQPTYFVEKLYNSIPWDTDGMDEEIGEALNNYCMDNPNVCKHHTIRSGNRWKAGDKFSPRVWSGKPYNSKMIAIAPDIEIKKVWDINIEVIYTEDEADMKFCVEENLLSNEDVYRLAKNDGLEPNDMFDWFSKPMQGQIICWNENIEY